MTVSQLVQSATGADYVSIISDAADSDKVTVMVMAKNRYHQPILTRYYAEVVGGELVSLEVVGAVAQDEDDSEAYRSEYAMGGQW